jgi:hypothetical protein
MNARSISHPVDVIKLDCASGAPHYTQRVRTWGDIRSLLGILATIAAMIALLVFAGLVAGYY